MTTKFKFISDCLKFRETEKGEQDFQEILKNSCEISEKEFLKDLDLNKLLDIGESWDIYKNSEKINFFKSNILNIKYKYFQVAGFEFIFKELKK